MKTYKFYSDPAHGWLAVKRRELEELGILPKISRYSYQRGSTVYLEEDCDAPLFFRAKTEQGLTIHEDYGVVDKHTDKRSPIRSYPSFSP